MGKQILVLLLIGLGSGIALVQGTTLVDFGSSAPNNTFGLAGWNTVLKSNNLSYTALGNSGVVALSEIDEFADFRGVRGPSRQFTVGERIVVTWFNNSDETVRFTARISFNDANEPNEITPDGHWYTMRSFDDYRNTWAEILPHSTAKTAFNIAGSGVHQTNAAYSLVNINLAIEWGSTYQKPFLICDKIELLPDADLAPPAQPTGLAASAVSDSKIQLNWNVATDDVAVVEYLIYQNGAVEGYSRSNQFTSVFLEPEKTYAFSVTALDAAGNESLASSPAAAKTHVFKGASTVINPAGLEYRGAFVLPEDFSWGGEAIAYFPDGNGGPSGPADGFPGSLFVTNLNQPENGLVGEVSIPAPIILPAKNVALLNQAAIVTQPVNIRPANVNGWEYVDIWRTGLEFVPEEKRLYSSWSIHYTVTEEKHASISCCSATNLAGSPKFGAWYIGRSNQPPLDAMANDWLLAAPQSWADANCAGRNLLVGRSRDGGLSGLGPTLYAFSKVGATPPAANSELPTTTLLQYGSVLEADDYHFPNSVAGYKHSDDWREAVWLTASNQNAVAMVGNKALGHNWYGYHGERMRHDWVIADVPYPEFYETDPDGKGWRAHNRQPMIIFFNPADLAKVAAGQMQPFEPQPYSAFRIPKALFWGATHEIFSATCDNQNRLLYVTEFVREFEGRLLLHVWRINSVTTSIKGAKNIPSDFQLDQNFPNPFNSATQISYRLPVATHVVLKIFNLHGQAIRTLVQEFQPAGGHALVWNGADEQGQPVATGVYFYQISSNDFSGWKKMLLIQ
jgi:hypothetical protein